MTNTLVVRRIDDGTEVSRIDVSTKSERLQEKALMGLLRSMDTDTYFVDEEE